MGSSPSSLDALGRPLNLSEPQCPHLRNGTTQHLPPSTAVRNELLVCVKCAQRATRATKGGARKRGTGPWPPPHTVPRLTQRDGLAVLLVGAHPRPGTAALLRVCKDREEEVVTPQAPLPGGEDGSRTCRAPGLCLAPSLGCCPRRSWTRRGCLGRGAELFPLPPSLSFLICETVQLI